MKKPVGESLTTVLPWIMNPRMVGLLDCPCNVTRGVNFILYIDIHVLIHGYTFIRIITTHMYVYTSATKLQLYIYGYNHKLTVVQLIRDVNVINKLSGIHTEKVER